MVQTSTQVNKIIRSTVRGTILTYEGYFDNISELGKLHGFSAYEQTLEHWHVIFFTDGVYKRIHAKLLQYIVMSKFPFQLAWFYSS